MLYAAERFTADEQATLRPYFTNLDGPVFALVNLPEVVKGALFARYSRSDKSLRRLFLDEFVGDLDLTGDLTVDATVGLRRAEELYDRVFFEYGDDSVAQLGGVHLACEQASNLLTKILEWGRLMAYLEQSTRYIPYDARLGGPVPLPAVRSDRRVAARHALRRRPRRPVRRPTPRCSRCSWTGRASGTRRTRRLRLRLQADDQGEGVRRGAWRSCPRRRSPTSASTAPGRRTSAAAAHARAPAARGAAVRRADARGAPQGHPVVPHARRPARPRRRVERLPRPDPRGAPSTLVDRHVRGRSGRAPPGGDAHRLRPRGRGQGARRDLLPAHEPPRGPGAGARAPALRRRARRAARRLRRRRATTGGTSPGRAFERTGYRFDVLGDYGAFRDLQRHRMLTIEWQALSPRHGYDVPERDRGGRARPRGSRSAMARSADLYDVLAGRVPRAGVVRGVARVPHAIRRCR